MYWNTTGGDNNWKIQIDPSLSNFSREDAKRTNYVAAIFYEYGSTTIYGHNSSGDPEPQLAPVPGNAFVPKCVAGVPTGAANESAGKLFIKTLLECQTVENIRYTPFSGFLVRKDVEKQALTESYERALTEKNLSFPNPDTFNMDGFIAQLKNASTENVVLREKVYTQAQMLYNGTISLDEAVANVLQSTKLYFAERQ